MSPAGFSLRHPWTVLAAALLVAALGIFAFFRLPIDLFPDTVPPQVAVVTVYPGAGAADVADKITQVLEKELYTLSGLARVSSTSRDEVSSIRAEFLFEKPVGEAVTDVQNAVARVRAELPSGIREPRLDRITDATRPLLTLALGPGEGSLKSLADIRLLAENEIKDGLLAIPGVGDVQVFGGHRPEVEVRVDRDALAARNLALGEVIARIAAQNVSAPAGTIYGSRGEYLLRVAGEFPSARALERLPIAATATGQVLLGDVAEVRLAEADLRSIYHGNGRPAIALNVLRPDGGDTVAAIRAVKAALPALERSYPDIAFAVTEDQQPIIDLNVHGMRTSLLQAVLLTILVIFLFLGDLRAAAAASLAIPLSFLAALAVLWFSPFTLNMVTLTGLIVAVGMVVDASVVVTENIYRHFRNAETADPAAAARSGTAEVALPITAGMLTTVVVLIPVMLTGGYTGTTMTPLNFVLVSTLVGSLLVALTVVPLLASRLLGRRDRRRNPLERLFFPVGKGVDRLAEFYGQAVRWSLRHRWIVLILAAAFVAFTFKGVRPLLGGELMPPMDTGIAIVEFDTAAGARPEEVEATLNRVEERIYRTPGVLTVSSVVGSEPGAVSFGAGGATTQSAKLTVRLVDRTRRRQSIWQIEQSWRDVLPAIDGIRTFRISEYGATPVSTTRAPFDVRISGPDPTVLDRLADAAWERLEGLPGLVDLRRSWYRDKPEQVVTVDPQLARLHGTSPAEVAQNLRAAVQGIPATSLRLEGFLDIPVRVRLRADQVDDPARLEEIPVPTQKGLAPLRSLAGIERRLTAPFVTREELQNTIDITAGNQVLTIAQVTLAANKRLSRMPLPAGYTLEMVGTARDMAEGQKEMGRALVLGLVLLFFLLLAMFKSPWHPVTIMAAIPLAVAGSIWGLLAFDKPFCKPAMMGLILVGGTIVNNAILLLDFILVAQKKGMAMDEAILQSVRLRLRPILMTAASTIVGFSPLIFETAVGLERMSPLGIAAGAGLLVGTVVTTVATPVIFSLFESLRLTLAGVWGRGAAARTAGILLLAALALPAACPAQAQEALPDPLTLEAAVTAALEGNPDLAASRAEVARLTGVQTEVRAAAGVRLDLGAGAVWSQEDHNMIPQAASGIQRFDDRLLQAGLAGRYLLLDFRRTAAEVRAALDRTRAGGSQLTRRRQEIAFEAGRLFLAALSAQDLLQAAEATRRSLETLAAATGRLVEQGRAARIDALKVRVQLAEVESRIASLRGERRSLRAALAAVIGADGDLPPLAYSDPGMAPAAEEAGQPALTERPDLRAMASLVEAAAEEAQAARLAYLPRIDLTASYTQYGALDPRTAQPSGPGGRWEDDVQAGVQLSWTLLDGGLRRGRLQQALAQRRAAEAALARQRLAARREVEQALADLESARASAAANAEAVAEAVEALRVETLKYEAGRGIVNDVLDAEAARLEAESREREARRRIEIARLALELARGELRFGAREH